MEFFNSLNLTQIKGGTKLKQGDLGSVLSYSLTDENGQEITSFDNKTAYINLVLDDKIWFTTTTLVDISRVTFRIDKAIPIGLYYLEIKIDDYIFPSDRDSIILIEEGSTPYDLKELVPNYDINMTLKGILSDLSQKGIDISDLNRRIGNVNAELIASRNGKSNLKTRIDDLENKTTEQLAQKANKDEVTNVMTPKGTLAYASLPTSGNQVGWYYYCPDGDGTHGAGNYVWNGTSWYFGGTGDEGYNLLKEDLVDTKPYFDELEKYLIRDGNLIDTKFSMVGKDILTTDTPKLEYVDSASRSVSDYIKVNNGDTLVVNTSIFYAGFDKNKEWDKQLRRNINAGIFTVSFDGFIRVAYTESVNIILKRVSDTKDTVGYSFDKLTVKTSQLDGALSIDNKAIQLFKGYDDFFKYTTYFSYDKSTVPYKVTYQGTSKYPFDKTYYDISGDVEVYFFIDVTFDFEASNISKVSVIHYGFNNVNNTRDISVDDGGHLSFLAKVSASNLSNACFEWGFRNFTYKDSSSTSYDLTFTVNSIGIYIIDKPYTEEFSEDELKEILLKKGIDEEGNIFINNASDVMNSDFAVLSDETKFVRTGWYGKKICTFGDSTIAQGRWQPFMAKRLGCTYTNRGIGGTTLGGTGSTCYTHDDRINTIDADADAIVIFGGFNDVGQGLVQNGSFDLSDNISDPSRWNYDPTTVQGAISLLAKKIRAVNPTAPIIFACLPYGFAEISRPSVHKFREYAKEGCYYNGVDFIDMYQLCNWSFDNADSFHPSGDVIHFDDNLGAKRIAGIVCDALMKYEPFN